MLKLFWKKNLYLSKYYFYYNIIIYFFFFFFFFFFFLSKTELKNYLNNLLKGFKIYQDIITEEKESYKNNFSEYKNNFNNIVIIYDI